MAIYKRWALAAGVLLAGCGTPHAELPPIPWAAVADSLPGNARVVLIGDSLGDVPSSWAVVVPNGPQVGLARGAYDVAIVTHPLQGLEEPRIFWESLRRGLKDDACVWALQPLPPDSLRAPYRWQRPIASVGWRGHHLDTLASRLWLRATR